MVNSKYSSSLLVVSILLIIIIILSPLLACSNTGNTVPVLAGSYTAEGNTNYCEYIQEISSEICSKDCFISNSVLDQHGIIWALVTNHNNAEHFFVRYNSQIKESSTLLSLNTNNEAAPVILSDSPCVVYTPSDELIYIFGSGKNMQIIDLSGKNAQNPLFCSSPQTLFWTDRETNQIYRLSLEDSSISPVFDTLLEYNNINTISSGGNSILLSADPLKDTKPNTLVANANGDIITADYCSDCIYGMLGTNTAQLHITEKSANIIYNNIDYPLGLDYTPISSFFSNEGIIAVLCSDDYKNFQLYCYSLVNEQLAYIGGGVYSFDSHTVVELSGIALSKDGGIDALLSIAHDKQKLYLWHIHHTEKIILFGTCEGDVDANSIFKDNMVSKVNELENRYNIRILYGEDAALTFPDYKAEAINDDKLISAALEELDTALSRYPKGYFECITDGVSRGILFCLTGPMHPTNNINISNPDAFAVIHCNTQIIALNIAADNDIECTIHHEISHATDKKIAAGAADGSIEFSKDVWNSFNPNGFEYFNAYLDPLGNSYSYTGGLQWTAFDHKNAMEDIYFVDSYSKTFASEDRARLMEAAMSSDPLPDYINSPNIQAKLSYYFAAIRQIPGIAQNASLYWERALLNPVTFVTGR